MNKTSEKGTKKERPRWLTILLRVLFCIGIGLGCLIIALVPIWILLGTTVFARVHETSNPKDYLNVVWSEEGRNPDVYDKWNIWSHLFPEELTDDMTVREFKKVHYDPWDPNDLALLVVEYNEKAFQKEVKRLESYKSSTYLGVYGITGFRDWNLLAIEASDDGVDYAMTRKVGEIVYFKLSFCNYFTDIDYKKYVPEQYLPAGFDATEGNPRRVAFDEAFDEDNGSLSDSFTDSSLAYLYGGKEFVECQENNFQFVFNESERTITGWELPNDAKQEAIHLYFGKRNAKDKSPKVEGYAYSAEDLSMFLSLKPTGLLIQKDGIPDYANDSEIEYLLFSPVYDIYEWEAFPETAQAVKVTDAEDIALVEKALKNALETKDDKTVALSASDAGDKRFQIGIKYKGCGAIHWDRSVALDKNGNLVLVKEAWAADSFGDAVKEDRGCKLNDTVINVFQKYSKT